MELSNLRPALGSVKTRKRIGRGTGSGHGGTSTRGHKGDKARSGSKEKRHFEGGQTPLYKSQRKFGFSNAQFRAGTGQNRNLRLRNGFDRTEL